MRAVIAVKELTLLRVTNNKIAVQSKADYTIWRHAQSLHGLSADQKFEVRADCRQIASYLTDSNGLAVICICVRGGGAG